MLRAVNTLLKAGVVSGMLLGAGYGPFVCAQASAPEQSDNTQYTAPTEAQLKAQGQQVEAALKAAESLLKDDKFVEKLEQDGRAVSADLSLPAGVDTTKIETEIGSPNIDLHSILNEAQQSSVAEPVSPRDKPLVLVSFSMPEKEIKSLLLELGSVGSGAVIRGLYKNDFKATVQKVTELNNENAKFAGFGIDPTVFERFEVSRVPTFILPLEPLLPCTPNGCPVPRHVKATGSVSLGYFLETVSRTATNAEEKQAAQRWLEALEK